MTDQYQGRVFAIGDVHGCLHELEALIKQLHLTPNDRVVFAGDLVDKGPDTAGVVKAARELGTKCKVDLVLGNHEEGFLRWLSKSEEKRPDMKRHNEFVEHHRTMNAEDYTFLKTARLYVKVPGGVVTHAGIPEFLRELPEVEPHASAPKKVRDLAKTMCRLRYVDDKGTFVSLNEVDTNIHTFWAARYGGQFGVVWFGHEPYLQDHPEIFSNAFGIDLACVFGGWLCAAEIGTDGLPVRIYTEKARESYAPLRGEE